MPRVSVVIPAWNSVDFIARTIESVKAQTYRDFELIVQDHSSTDGTTEVLQRFAEQGDITLTTLPKGGGAPANWKSVTARASGEYLKLVCGDDVLAPTILAAQVEEMDAHPSAVLASSKRDLIDAHDNRVMGPRGLQGLRGVVDGRQAARRSVICGTNIFGEPNCVLFRHQAFLDAGGWEDAEPFVIDQYTYCKVLMQGDFVAVPGTQSSFRVSAGQWSVHLTRQQAEQVVGMHHGLARDNPGLLSRRDLLIGDTRARLMAQARRLNYLYLGRRMHAIEQKQTGR